MLNWLLTPKNPSVAVTLGNLRSLLKKTRALLLTNCPDGLTCETPPTTLVVPQLLVATTPHPGLLMKPTATMSAQPLVVKC